MTQSPSPRELIALCRQKEIRVLDLRFVDFRGQQRHFTIPVDQLTEDRFQDGFGFDGSSMQGWQAIHESDMLLIPDASTAYVDPFMSQTLAILGNIRDPATHQCYPRDPRNIAHKATLYMQSTGIADAGLFGADIDFFVFDSARFDQGESHAFHHLESIEGQWSRGTNSQAGSGHHVRHREGYQAMPPNDSLQDLRTSALIALEESGIAVTSHRREVASGGQCEISLAPHGAQGISDAILRMKYFVRNVAAAQSKVATFMPKPLYNDNGSGLHLQLSLMKDEKSIFSGTGYGGLSEVAMHAMGGILSHAPALLAFCCPTTNSYRRLIPGFEAPVNLSYSYRNRSAAIRIPVDSGNELQKRIEFRCPDSSCNPYLATSAILMAMLDGIQNRISPGKPLDKDLYDLAPEEQISAPSTPETLERSLSALESDQEFLLQGDVFTPDVIDTWIESKREFDVNPLRQRPHPYEFAMYFDC